MRVFTTICAMALPLPLVHAQIQTNLRALTPLTIQIADGTNTASATTPAGLLGAQGETTAILPSMGSVASGSVRWSAAGTYVRLTHSLENPLALPTFSGVAGPHEFVLEFQAPSPRAAVLQANRLSFLSPGAPAAAIAIDIGNDGSIEIANLSSASITTIPVSIGAQPLQVRVVVQATLGAAMFAYEDAIFLLTPDNNLRITQVVGSCAPFVPPPPTIVAPSFLTNGIDLQPQFQLGVLVLGLMPQPNLLSVFSQTGLPCVLMPRPDVVLFGSAINLPIPQSVRPITIYAQAVGLEQGELIASDAYSVIANL